MTIRHLTIFVAVADQGSMSAAAAHLYLSQPRQKALPHRTRKSASAAGAQSDPPVPAA